MSVNASAPWLELFPPPADAAQTTKVRVRLLCRRGEPLLLLPSEPRFARASLSLYPAQTVPARFARTLIRICSHARLPMLTTPVVLSLDAAAPFVRFLAGANAATSSLAFALLLGNPRAKGRRFVLLLFDADGTPVKLIKAGVGKSAVALIRREAAFLKSQPHQRLHAPALRGEFADEDRAAMVLDYAPGDTPGDADIPALPPLLESWIHTNTICRFWDLPAVQRLATAAAEHPAYARIVAHLADVRLRPAVFHGDFTPWNIRVHPATGQWTVLDWERGDVLGPPAWDWFHFVIQNEILVRHAKPADVMRRLTVLLNGSAFRQYSRRTNLGESAPALLAAYLVYCCLVVKQAEGQRGLAALLDLHLSEMGLCR